MSNKVTRTVYFVRGGTHSGAYLTRKVRGASSSRRAYSWTNFKNRLTEMTYDQARNAVRQTYGGNVVKRVYQGKNIVSESVVA